MCGIVGYSGKKNASEVLFSGLKNLEYRGYDSAGIAVFSDEGIIPEKAKGRLSELKERLKERPVSGCCGIGHTRWATHGEPSDENSHPHGTDKVMLVHNGIIENYVELKNMLINHGYDFVSQTDTEVAAKLIDYCYKGNPLECIKSAVKMLEGSFALGVIFEDRAGVIYAIRKDSPLIVALGNGENFIASDMPAVLEYTDKYYLLDEYEIAEIASDSVYVYDMDLNRIDKTIQIAAWSVEQARKNGYPHFMLKEIFEQPVALHNTVSPRMGRSFPDFTESGIPSGFFKSIEKIHIIACGTAMHAGLVAKTYFENLSGTEVEVDLASEFRYRKPILKKERMAIIISQSGETADSLAALRLCKQAGMPVVGVVNVSGSSIARESDHCIYTYAGPEIAVASTKAYSVQIATMFMLALRSAIDKGLMDESDAQEYSQRLKHTLELTKKSLLLAPEIENYAAKLTEINDLFFIGRGLDYALAMEGSLKLKEISYIHSEAYAAGELKHGPISLIVESVPVIALATQKELLPKVVSNIREVKARGGDVLLITREDFDVDNGCYDKIIKLPATDELLMPLLSVSVLQLLAYYAATLRGNDVDKPRNLAKSVTVE